jgi:hypothetical protein
MLPQLHYYRDNGTQATGTVTVLAAPALNDTVTIAGTVYTFGTTFMANTLKLNEVALALAAAVNADPARYGQLHTNTQPVKSVFAIAYGTVVRIIASAPGAGGNALGLAESTGATKFSVSAATLAGGA